MYKCYACGKEIEKPGDQCPYCRFPVISFTPGDKNTDEQLRQFAEEYRKNNPEFFAAKLKVKTTAPDKVNQQVHAKEKAQAVALEQVKTAEEAAGPALQKEKPEETVPVHREKKPGKGWIAAEIIITLLLIAVELFLFYGYCVTKAIMPNIPIISNSMGRNFFDAWHRWLILRIRFSFYNTILEWMTETWNGYMFAILSLVLGLAVAVLGWVRNRLRKTPQKVICTVLFWILLAAYLHLMFSVPVNILYHYWYISFYAFAGCTVIHTILMIQIIKGIIGRIVRVFRNRSTSYWTNRIKMNHNEVVRAAADSVKKAHPETIIIAADRLSFMSRNTASAADADQLIRYADYGYDRMDGLTMRVFADVIVHKTSGEYVREEQENGTAADEYTYTLIRRDIADAEKARKRADQLKKW